MHGVGGVADGRVSIRKMDVVAKELGLEFNKDKCFFSIIGSRKQKLHFAGNYAPSAWLCKCKIEVETEFHLTSGYCPIYGDLVEENMDMSDDETLVNLFNKVLDRRDQLDNLV